MRKIVDIEGVSIYVLSFTDSGYYLYLILDIYSRKVVGWEVYDIESTENASELEIA